ncbi:MAG: polysaccharide export protein [Alphaproteobacteria bacterium]|nr:polysaccharide export protein [Alphaproteobacteria bacterium]
MNEAKMGKETRSYSHLVSCCRRAALCLAASVFLAGCGGGAITGSPEAVAQADAAARNYRLAAGDKVHVAVFNEDNLSGDYTIGPGGRITLPLAGPVTAAGLTVPQLQVAVVKTLANGFVQNPSVTVTAMDLRPYYILGEVNKPGKYDYAPDLTVMQAVATAEGFTYRADSAAVYIRHKSDPSEKEVSLDATTAVLPGDTIRVAQRYF